MSPTRWIALALAAYVAGFIFFRPRVLVVNDEAMYVTQAYAFAQGRLLLPSVSTADAPEPPSLYPPGTSLLQAPLVRLGGWMAAPWASVLCLVTAVVVLARWLSDAGRSPIYSLVLLGYPPALVLGRVAMSDVPSAAVTALGMWVFWRGAERHWRNWLAAGFLAGASILFRETNALIFLPFFVGALLRRERHTWALIAGGLVGIGLRLVSFHVLFGSALFLRHPGAGWSWHHVAGNLPLYLFALLVLIPGGLLAGVWYRGARRVELQACIVIHLAFYLSYSYSAEESGWIKRIVLGPRYYLPLAAILAFALAEVAPRVVSNPRVLGRLLAAGAAGVLIAAFAVHPVMAYFEALPLSIVRAIYANTPDGAVLITESGVTAKFILPMYGRRVVVSRGEFELDNIERLRVLHGAASVVQLDRDTGSMALDRRNADTHEMIEQISRRCRLELLYDRWHDRENRLRIWNVSVCAETSPAGR